MKTRYIVCDQDGNISYDKKAENPESFPTFRKAEARAKELAGYSPGDAIGIYELVGEAIVETKPVSSSRKYPIEHYK